MTIKKMVSIAVCFSLLLSYSAGAINQNPETDNDSGSITMNDILTPEKKTDVYKRQAHGERRGPDDRYLCL